MRKKNVVTVLTYKGVEHILNDGGSQSWAANPDTLRRAQYLVCVRHAHGPYRAEGNEKHKHAFLVARISGAVQSDETGNRFKITISDYAVIDGPYVDMRGANPVQYWSSLSDIGIDEDAIQWTPLNARTVVDRARQMIAEAYGVDPKDIAISINA